MKGKLLIISILIFSAKFVIAQKEANNWYFGQYAGLDFSPGVPVALTNGAMSQFEGTACISDKDGKLLFYTSGMNLWNRNHVVMPNGSGLMGDPSSSQSAVIVPKPANEKIYYVFTVAAQAGAGGLQYSVVDMSLQGGLGDISIKNVPLKAPVTEKITAVKHKNGCDIWVIAHDWSNNKFLAYLLTSSGLSTSAVVSAVGTPHIGSPNNTIGYMKVSPNGSRIALAVDHEGDFAELFDFNNSTGVVSHAVKFEIDNPYGVEFSSDNTKLYISAEYGSSSIYQYNLEAGSDSAIIASQYILDPLPRRATALQLGPDQKIYFIGGNSQYMGVINYPNKMAPLCDVVDNFIYLGGKYGSLGLPNFIQSYFDKGSVFSSENKCFGEPTHFSYTDSTYSVLWNFGDPGSGTLNTSSAFSPYHLFSAPGSYKVELLIYKACYVDTVTANVMIYNLPAFDLGPDQTRCDVEELQLGVPVQGTYLWQDGSTEKNYIVKETGNFWVNVKDVNGCKKSDSIFVNVRPPAPMSDSGHVVCSGTDVALKASGESNGSISWYTDAAGSSLLSRSSSVILENLDSAGVFVYYCDQTIGQCRSLMGRTEVTVEAVEAEIGYAQKTQLNGMPVEFLNLTTGGLYYRWDFGDSTESEFKNPVHIYQSHGLYKVTLFAGSNACIDSTFIYLNIEKGIRIYAPNAFTSNGDGKNDVFKIIANGVSYFKAEIYNRWGEKVFQWDNPLEGWNGENCQADVYTFVVSYKLGKERLYNKIGHVTLLK